MRIESAPGLPPDHALRNDLMVGASEALLVARWEGADDAMRAAVPAIFSRRAISAIDTPAFVSARISISRLAMVGGLPIGLPDRVPWRLACSIPPRTRSTIRSRSKLANTLSIPACAQLVAGVRARESDRL